MVLVTVILVALGSAASAHRQGKSDPNDTSGDLDISRLLLAHDAQTISITVKTFEGWNSSILRGQSGYVRVDVDPPGGNDHGYAIYAKYKNGELRGVVKRIDDDFTYRKVGRARVKRPSRRSVRLTVSRDLINADKSVSWSGQASVGDGYDRTPTWFHGL